MRVTLSAIKADIGAIGGHTRPSDELVETVRKHVERNSKGLLIDYYIGYTGDDIHIIMTHTLGTDNEKIHKLAWDAFTEGTKLAKEQGLYGAGQDLLKDAFSGNEIVIKLKDKSAHAVVLKDKENVGRLKSLLFHPALLK